MNTKILNDYMKLMLKTNKQETNYLNYSHAFWDCFEFHFTQVGKMLLNQTMFA